MIYLIYFIVAWLVVRFSIMASNYIDMIDRSTRLSGAFLGGVLLSAVTSLPELFTSISASPTCAWATSSAATFSMRRCWVRS